MLIVRIALIALLTMQTLCVGRLHANTRQKRSSPRRAITRSALDKRKVSKLSRQIDGTSSDKKLGLLADQLKLSSPAIKHLRFRKINNNIAAIQKNDC